jgi:hypothetical protein
MSNAAAKCNLARVINDRIVGVSEKLAVAIRGGITIGDKLGIRRTVAEQETESHVSQTGREGDLPVIVDIGRTVDG